MLNPLAPTSSTIKAVNSTDIKIFTRLFPIKEVVKNFCLSFKIFSTLAAFLFFFSRKYFIFNLFTDKKAVSPDENIIDKKRRVIKSRI